MHGTEDLAQLRVQYIGNAAVCPDIGAPAAQDESFILPGYRNRVRTDSVGTRVPDSLMIVAFVRLIHGLGMESRCLRMAVICSPRL